MRIRLARIGRTAIDIHGGALLCMAYMWLAGHEWLAMVSMVSITLHELAHAAAAVAAGYPPEELELTPMGAVMRLSDEESIPPGWKMVILLAGPVATLLICWCSIWFVQLGWIPLESGRMLFLCNLTLLCLNLLPSLPLDGGSVCMLLLKCWVPDDVARRVMRAISTVLGLFCIGANLWLTWHTGGWNLSLACAGCFMIYGGASASMNNALHELRGFLDRRIRMEERGIQRTCCLSVLDSLPLRKAVLRLHPRRQTQYWVVSDDLCRGVLLTEQRVIAAYLNTPGGAIQDAIGGECSCN